MPTPRTLALSSAVALLASAGLGCTVGLDAPRATPSAAGDAGVDAVGAASPEASARADGTAPEASPASSTLACPAVAGFTASSTSQTAVRLTWAGASDVTILVARKTYCGSDAYETLTMLPAGTAAYTDSTVQANWAYWYEITATDGAGNSASAALSTQAASSPAAGCAGGTQPQPSGVSGTACSTPLDAGGADSSPMPDGAAPADDGGGAASPPPIPANAAHVSCSNSAGDAAMVQAAIDASAAVVLSGTCNLGTTSIALPANEFVAGPATLVYSGSGYAMQGSGSGDTLSQLTFNGGGVELTSGTDQAGWTIVFNTFQNITSGSDGVHVDSILGKGAASSVSNNAFKNIWSGGYPSIPAGQTYSTCGNECIYGTGFFWHMGLDNTTVDSNTFDQIGYNAIKGFWDGFQGKTDPFTGHNVVISNNTITNTHRIGIEFQNVGQGNCPGGCDYPHVATDGTVIKGNFFSKPAFTNNVFAFSLMTGSTNSVMINNTGNNDVATCYVRAGIGLENAPWGGIVQGNVIASIGQSCSSVGWADAIACGYTEATATNEYQNNIVCGPGAAAQGSIQNGQDPGNSATMVETADLWTDTCPGLADISTGKIVLTFLSPDNQNLSSGGAGTWSAGVVSTLSVRDVRFFLDGATTAAIVQEVQDVSQTFEADRQWLYHATIDTTSLASGSHTITARATDVSGVVQSAMQTFTR